MLASVDHGQAADLVLRHLALDLLHGIVSKYGPDGFAADHPTRASSTPAELALRSGLASVSYMTQGGFPTPSDPQDTRGF
jgi:hypothetical protein